MASQEKVSMTRNFYRAHLSRKTVINVDYEYGHKRNFQSKIVVTKGGVGGLKGWVWAVKYSDK